MASNNGRLPSSSLVALPTSWSNKREVERLDARAAASLSRMMLRAVAHTGSNFSVWDAYRDLAEQVAMLRQNYRPVDRARSLSSDRSYGGQTWERRPGRPSTASPGHSNHGTGLAIDLHSTDIQEWVQENGLAYGWSWAEGRKLGEGWHFVYVPALDRFTGQGTPDVAAIQRAVGVTPDGKFGTGTAAAVKLWQASHGLTADGIPGPATIATMVGGQLQDAVVDAVVGIIPKVPAADGFAYTYAREDWDPAGVGERVHVFDHTVLGTYIHHPGTDQKLGGLSHAEVFALLRSYRDDHVNRLGWADFAYGAVALQDGTTIEGRGLGMETGANGGEDSNNEAPAILAMLGNGEEPTPELDAAINGLLAQVRAGYATVEYVRGHRHSPDASTTCPGDPLQQRIDSGAYSYDGSAPPAAAPNPVAPSTAARIPTGKDLLMALIDAPDFPLLRTPGARCYYGPEGGPVESVSGKSDNSLHPGEIRNGGAEGLRAWQKRMKERGYTITVDGRYGGQSANAAANLQKLAGLPVDHLIGPDTWYAAWVLPVK